jgi:hypothetical protein
MEHLLGSFKIAKYTKGGRSTWWWTKEVGRGKEKNRRKSARRHEDLSCYRFFLDKNHLVSFTMRNLPTPLTQYALFPHLAGNPS